MEKHVASLEISKRLKALGVKQESIWYWSFYALEGSTELPSWHLVMTSMPKDDYVSAFLASELGEMLPMFLHLDNKHQGNLHIGNTDSQGWVVWYENCPEYSEHENSMCDAMALMLEYLIQNKLITI